MENETALVIYAGGIREIMTVMGTFAVPGFREIILGCSTVLGTSAGALMGFIIACCERSAGDCLSELEKKIEPDLIHLTWWDIIVHLLRGQDLVTPEEMKKLLRETLAVIQPEAEKNGKVTLYRDLIVGEVLHTKNVPHSDGQIRHRYQEHVFKKGTHDLEYVLKHVVGSASIIGVTTSNISDGAQMHSFPVDYYVNNIMCKKQRVFMISPYPMLEMMTPVADDDAPSRLVRIFYSIFYGSQMYRAGDDARIVLRNGLEPPKMVLDTAAAEVYTDSARRVLAVCPRHYIAANCVISLDTMQRKNLLKVGEEMGRAMVDAASMIFTEVTATATALRYVKLLM